jgi:hypothetical protein
MEQRSAFLLFTEFLRSPDPQVRRNALSALAAIQSEDSLGEVVRVALSDPDPQVRQRAEDELVSAAAQSQDALTKALWKELRPGKLSVAAYALIGRLRGRGVNLRLPGMSLLRKLKFAFALRRGSGERRPPALRKSAFFGGLLGAVGLLLYLNLAMRVDLGTPGAAGIALAALILPFAIIFVTYRWWLPIQIQPDRAAGAFLDLFSLAVLGGVAGLMVVALFLVFEHGLGTATSIAVVSSAAALSFGAARAGTLITHGCAWGTLANRIVQVVSGAAAGAVVLTAISVGIGLAEDKATAVAWVVFLPVLLGLSFAVSAADFAGYSAYPAQTLMRKAAGAIVAIVLFASTCLLGVLGLISRDPGTPAVILSDGGLTIPIRALPANINLTVKDARLVRFEVPEEAKGLGDFQISLRRGAAPARQGDRGHQAVRNMRDGALDYQDDPPEIEEWLRPGKYQIAVDGSHTGSSILVLSEPLPFLLGRIKSRGVRSQVCTLVISSNRARSPEALVESASAKSDSPRSPDAQKRQARASSARGETSSNPANMGPSWHLPMPFG